MTPTATPPKGPARTYAHPSSSISSSSSKQATSAVDAQPATAAEDVLAAAVKELGGRGIINPDHFRPLGAEAILGTVRWFDAQNGRVGTGVLIHELRAGGKPGWQPAGSAAVLQRQADYASRITAWLDRYFPDLDRHPAAVAAVIRLHYLHGKGSLTAREHGPTVRAAVAAFRARWETA